jgi:Zn-dependent M28 family amino/carboxypeptidase
MRISKWLAGVALAAVATTAMGQTAQGPLDPKQSADNIRAHMTFLADDLLLGREAGSDTYNIAAHYVASQFAQLGLKPAGDKGSYFQAVPLVAFRGADEGSFALRGPSGTIALRNGEDIVTGRNPGPAERKVSAPLVFVGYGIVDPARGRDDYAGLDVKGKIVVALSGAPAAMQSEERAYYGNGRNKRAAAQAKGAIGFITLDKPADEKRRPFKDSANSWKSWAMGWRNADGSAFDVAPGVPAIGHISAGFAPKLFAGTKATYQQVVAAAEKGNGVTPRFALPYTLDATLRSESKPVESMNVAGMIEGSDPVLKNEVIVLSAHLDHVGVTPSAKGDDKINNGALDNASGIATTLEVARAFRESGKPPRRSLLILAVTAEEKGLVGADYFARNPTVPARSMVANVNLDMPILYYDFQDVIAFGADRSTMGPAVRRAGQRMGVEMSPDPLPEEGLFTRSDHYRFVEQGVPAVFLMTGFKNGGEKQFRGFLAGCYHHPCDDLTQPIDYAAGAKFARINYEIARELADADARPAWNKGDFFGEKFGRK